MGVAAMYLLNFEIIFSPFPRRVLQKLIRSWELLFCLFSSRQVGAVFVGWGLNAHPVICFDITLIGQPRLFTSLSGRLFSGAFILEKEKQFSCKQCYLWVFNQTANYSITFCASSSGLLSTTFASVILLYLRSFPAPPPPAQTYL